LMISIDGPAEVHDLLRQTKDGAGSFNMILQSLSTLHRHGVGNINAEITFTTLHSQMGYTERGLLNFVKSLGFAQGEVVPCVSLDENSAPLSTDMQQLRGVTLEDYLLSEETNVNIDSMDSQLYYELYELKNMTRTPYADTICSVGYGNVTLFPDGSIYPCYLLSTEEHLLARFRDGAYMPEARGLEKIKSLLKSHNPVCAQCWRRTFCRGCLGQVYDALPDVCSVAISKSIKLLLTVSKLQRNQVKWNSLLHTLHENDLILDFRNSVNT